MDAFEYVSVLSSIVIGLGLADLLHSLHRMIRHHRRVRWDWAVLVAALFAVLVTVQIWWNLFKPDEPSITIGAFLPQFVELVLLFLLTACALPDEVPADGLDLRAYYDRNGPYFWSLFAAALAWPMLYDVVVGLIQGRGWAVLDNKLFDLGILALFVSLIFIRNRWWHAAAFAVMSLGPIGWMSRALST